MASVAQFPRGNGRHSILELAPLELECMNALWPLGEASVRQIRQVLLETRPRAYTTIMTIMDRLARKGVVARGKVGRAYLYRPNLTAEEARAHAVEQVVEGFFEGSAEALMRHLGAAAPAASANRRPVVQMPARVPAREIEMAEEQPGPASTRLDESLL